MYKINKNKYWLVSAVLISIFVCTGFWWTAKAVDSVAVGESIQSPIFLDANNVPDSAFKVIDQFKDKADLQDGRSVYKIYTEARQVERQANGELKLRSKDWNLFNEETKSKIYKSTRPGYNYSLSLFSKKNSLEISAGDLEYGNKNIVKPIVSNLNQENIDNRSISNLSNVYPGIDFQFVDYGQSRQKNIIIKELPVNFKDSDNLVIWEQINLGNSYNAYLANGTLISNDQDITQKGLYLKDNEGNRVDISTAIASDSSGHPSEFVENPNLYVPKQFVKIDKKNRILKVGVQVEGKYLLAKERVLPVIIDPTYVGCSEVTANNMTCTLRNFFFRTKSSANDTGGGICNPAGNCDANNPANNQKLFIGSYLSGSYYTRHALLYFDLPDLTTLGTISSAELHMYYNTKGSGNAGSASLKAKKVTSPVNPTTIPSGLSNAYSYSTVRTKLTELDSAITVSTATNNKWYMWDLTNTAKSWYNSPSGYFAVVVENSGLWSSGNTPPASWANQLFVFTSKEYSAGADVSSPYIKIITTAVAKPDLVIYSKTIVGSTTVTPGQSVDVKVKVKNQGTGNAATSRVGYYYSANSTCSSGSDIYRADDSSGSLTAGTISTEDEATITIPTDAQVGTRYICFIADWSSLIDESDETNNSDKIAITVSAPAIPDLTFSGTPTVNPTSPVIGGQTTINATIKNNGTATANSTVVTFYRDGINLGTASVSSLSAGGTANVSKNFTTANDDSVGEHEIQLTITSVSGETNTSNNTTYIYPTFVATGFELTPTSLSISDTSLHYWGNGGTITVNGVIKNNGTVNANGITYNLGIVNSQGQVWYLTSLSPSSFNVSAGGQTSVTLTGSIPSGLAAYNTYNVRIALDVNGDFTESNESNNTYITSNSVPIQQWSSGGGGGSSVPANSLPAAITIPVGTKANGQILIADKANYMKNFSIAADKGSLMIASNATADPVNSRNGAFEFEQTDFVLKGRGFPIKISRTYNSKAVERNERFGAGWSSSNHMYYFQDPSTKEVQIYLGGSTVAYFTTPDGGTTYVADKGNSDTLYNESGYLVYRTLDGIKYKFSFRPDSGINNVGMVESVVDTNNNTTQFTYITKNGIKLLSVITDPSGRAVQFIYPTSDTDPHWDKVKEIRESLSGTSKLIASYTYDSNNYLTQVHQENFYQSESVVNLNSYFTYSSSGLMTEYKDPRGTVLYNEYDATGRVTKQYEKNPNLGSGDKRFIYEIVYNDNTDAGVPGSAHCTITKNYRNTTEYYTDKVCFNSSELKIYQANGLGQAQTWTYDTNGMPATYTNANGAVSTYTYDSRRRLTKEILPDVNGNHTEKTYTYENNFNRLTSSVITSVKSGVTLTQTNSFTINPANGNISNTTDPMGYKQYLNYDAYGNVLSSVDKNGATTTYVYDAGNNYPTSESIVVKNVDNTAENITNYYLYNIYGHRTRQTDAKGNIYNYNYDYRGNLRQVTNPDNTYQLYTYDVEDHPLTTTDELGRITTNVYDKDINASLLSATKSGSTVSSQYDWVGNKLKDIDELNRETIYTYDSANRVITKQTPVNTINYTYDATGNLVSETNSLGQKIVYVYDARNQKIETRNYLDITNYVSTQQQYDGLGRVISATDASGNVTNYTYNLNNQVLIVTDPTNHVEIYTYDKNGNKKSITDKNNHTTNYYYDGLNRQIKEVNPVGKETISYYDKNSNLTKIIYRRNADGTSSNHISEFTYDNRNHKVSDKDAYGNGNSFTYDNVGNVLTKTDAINRTWTFTYDNFDRLLTEKDPANNQTSYTYDKVGNKTSITYPDNEVTNYVYDNGNRLTTITDTLGKSRVYTYDAVGNKLSEKDKRNFTTSFTYNKLNRLVTETNPQSIITTYTYDNNGNKLSTSVAGKVTNFEYDKLNRQTKITYPGNKVESVTYDAVGNQLTQTNGNGEVVSYVYDNLNLPIIKNVPGQGTSTYSYDQWNNVLAVNDINGSVNYTYDNKNRNLTESRVFADLPGKTYTISRSYYADDTLKTLTDASGAIITYNYDNRGLLADVVQGTKTLATYNYNSIGKPASLTYGNGVMSNYTYDDLQRLTTQEIISGTSTLFKHEYNYDAESNRTSVKENDNRTLNYTYDNLGQLTNVDYSNLPGTNDLSYTYDNWGNRLTLHTVNGDTSYTYAINSNELNSYTKNNVLTTDLTYDSNGSLETEITKQLNQTQFTNTYSWNALGQLTGIRYQYTNGRPDNTLAFAYDEFGNRIKKSINNTQSETTYYINNGLRVLNELDGLGVNQKTLVYGLEQIAELDNSGKLTYVHTDVLGSTVLLTDEQANKVAEFEYDPFGAVMGYEGTQDTNYLFTNQEFDPESELYYYNARYYNPVTGRFISRDSVLGRVGDALSRNGYIYVKNNPLKYTDPSGEEEKIQENECFICYDVTSDLIYKLKNNGQEMYEEHNQDLLAYYNALKKADEIPWWNPTAKLGEKLSADLVYEVERANTYLNFYNHVKPGGDWDYKIEDFARFGKDPVEIADVNDSRILYDTMGNINFGYTGKAAGLPAWMLRSGAGAAQIVVGTSKTEWYNSYFDDPIDQMMINVGITLYEKYGTNIDEKKLNKVLNWELGNNFYSTPGNNYWGTN
ncbi:MAG: CARDB domain-containing protein [Candidatus Magasanikiibacteriota bacterium]